MRPVVIVFLDPTGDRRARFFHAAILRSPDFLFFQAAMEPFDVAVAFRVVIRRPPVRDAEPPQRLQEARRSELRPVVRRECHARFTAALGQPFQHSLLHRNLSHRLGLQQHADSFCAQLAACGIRQTVCAGRIKHSRNRCLKKSVLDNSATCCLRFAIVDARL
jgi:hypothetical protein